MTTRYIDFLRGDDASADPTDSATPWKTFKMIVSVAAAPGDKFLFADDGVWDTYIADRAAVPLNWTGTAANPIYLGAYTPTGSTNPGGRPTFTYRKEIAAGEWTYSAPNNAWYYDQTPIQIGAVAYVRLGNTDWWSAGTTSTTTLPLASIEGAYKVSGSILYVYAPAGTDPTTYYGRAHLGVSGNGAMLNMSSRTCYVTLDGLLFKDSGTIFYLYSNTTNACGVNVLNCSMEGGSAAIVINPATVDTSIDILVDNFLAKDFGTTSMWTTQNSTTTIRTFEVRKSTFINGCNGTNQGQIYMQAPVRTGAVHHNIFVRSHFGGLATQYDGCGVYCELGSNGGNVHSNTFYEHGQAIILNSGKTAVVKNNKIYNCYRGITCSDGGAGSSTNYTIDNNTIVGGANIPADSGSALMNIGRGIQCYFTSAGGTINITIRNNIIVNTQEVATPAEAQGAILFWGSKPIGGYTLDISNNCADGFAYMATVKDSGVSTATTNPVMEDLLLSPDYQLTDASPAIESGVFLGYMADLTGQPFWNPPSIGAYEYQRARTAR